MSTSTGQSPENRSENVFYQTEDGRGRIQVRLEGETAWLPQALMAELFQTSPQNVTIHIREIYDSGELSRAATCKQLLQVRKVFLDKFLRDTELPVLRDAGSVRHDEAIEWAHAQYDAFAERRRLEAEAAAESSYLEDLRTSAKALEAKRRKRRPGKKRRK